MARISWPAIPVAATILLSSGLLVHDYSSHHSVEATGEGMPQVALHAAGSASGPCALLQSVLRPAKENAGAGANPGRLVNLAPAEYAESKNCGLTEHLPQFLIATVPHPTQSRLSLSFDRNIEALIRGAAARRYTLTNFWIPWKAGEFHATSYVDQKMSETDAEAREKRPGILLFRHEEWDQPALAVLLVPEMPSGGVDRESFRTALKIIPTEEVPLIGPNFSGSFQSLHELILASGRNFQTYNGSATSEKERANFKKKDASRLHSAIRTDKDTIEWLGKLCKGQWAGSGRRPAIAILAEDSTDYGRQKLITKGDCEVVSAGFPREISRLRSAYASQPETQQPTARLPGERELLPFVLRDAGNSEDTVPIQSKLQTPISQESVLSDISRFLRDRRVGYIVILATDPLDRTFLIRFLHGTVPAPRIIMLSGDVLFGRTASDDPTSGLFAISTYPLFPEAQDWTKDSKTGTTYNALAYSEAYGIYNAAMQAIIDPSPMKLPEEVSHYLLSKPPFSTGATTTFDFERLPLWLTVLGRGGYWPVAVKSFEGESSRDIDRFPVRPPIGYVLTLVVVACIGFGLWWKRRWTWWKGRWAGTESGEGYLMALGVLCAGIVAAMVMPLLVKQWGGVYGLALALAFCGFRLHVYWRKELATWALLVTGAALLLYCLTITDSNELRNIFFSYRSYSLLSGVSPLFPVLCLALVPGSWLVVKLVGINCHDEWEKQSSFKGVDATDRVYVESAFRQSSDWWLTGFGILTAGWAWIFIRPFEDAPFELLHAFLLALASALIARSAVKLWVRWSAFKEYLWKLNCHPLRNILQLMPPENSWSPLFIANTLQGNVMARYKELWAALKTCEQYAGPVATEDQEDVDALDKAKIELIAGALEKIVYRREEQKGTSMHWSRREEEVSAKLVIFKVDESERFNTVALEFLAISTYEYIMYVLARLRLNILFIGVGFTLISVSLLSYPFSSPTSVRAFITTWFIGLGAVVIRMMLSADRDEILSRINNTEPGQIGLRFVQRAIRVGIVPALAVAAAYFPQIGQVLSSLIGQSSAGGHG